MKTFKKCFKRKNHKMKRLAKIIKVIFFTLGILFFVMIALAFTSAPFYAYYHLGQNPNENDTPMQPQYVVMSGVTVSMLIRTGLKATMFWR